MQLLQNTIYPNKIGFDFDCVIADTATTFLQILCERHGFCDYTLENITDFEVASSIDVPQELVSEIFLALEHDPLPIPPVAGAAAVLEKMAEKYRPVIITARNEINPVVQWLQHHIPNISAEQFQISASGNPEGKLQHIHQYNLDYFVDDRAETCETLVGEGVSPLIFDRPWNRNSSLRRVMNWLEIQRLLCW